MPRGDGTGPQGQGPRTGRAGGGGGRGAGGGVGGGTGPGRMGGPVAAGPGGMCKCPNCGHQMSHQRGAPCYSLACPKCGTKMTRG